MSNDRDADVMIFVIGTCDDLVEKGIPNGGSHKLSPQGRSIYERLKSEGFSPTPMEFKWAMDGLMEESA